MEILQISHHTNHKSALFSIHHVHVNLKVKVPFGSHAVSLFVKYVVSMIIIFMITKFICAKSKSPKHNVKGFFQFSRGLDFGLKLIILDCLRL
jgi:hypothetical protein